MNTKSAKNWYETILDSQKKMAESLNENTKNWAGNNDHVNQALENSSEFFKKWLDFQMDFVKNSGQNDTMKNAEQAATESFNNWKDFYQNLYKSQVESINDTFKKNTDMFQQWTKPFGMSNPWMQVPGMDQFSGFNKNITEMYQTMMNQFNGTSNTKDIFEGMVNHTESFMKFYEMWNPVYQSMKDNKFSMDMMRNFLKPEAYKEFMDSFFGFMPANVKGMYNDQVAKMTESMQNFGKQGMDAYQNMSAQWKQFIPQGNGMFTSAMDNYNQMYNQMQNAIAPFAKLVTPNAFTKSSESISEILDMMNRYQIANSQMQYMTYTTGIKAMEGMGAVITEKLNSGKNYDSMRDLFKEWLNTSDKYFVELFETDEFSKAQAETSSLQMRIKQAMDLQMEKMFSNIPLVPRSEMEDLYKTIYELKKRVRSMEKELENNKETQETVVETKAASAPKASTKKAGK